MTNSSANREINDRSHAGVQEHGKEQTMDPKFLTAVERDPVESLEMLLEATDPTASERVLASCRTLINNKPASRLAARTAALNLGRHPSKRRKEIAEDCGVGPPAVSQTIIRIQRELVDRASAVREHALITYISEQIGSIALVSALPVWVQRIVSVEPSPTDDDWGTSNDLAQFITAIALGNAGFVPQTPTHSIPAGDRWWITPERTDLVESLASIAERITGESSRAYSQAELQRELKTCGVVESHHGPLIEAMASSRRLLWLPSGQCYVVFGRDPNRSSQGSAPQRAQEVLSLLPHLNPERLTAELVSEFINQHGLKPGSAAAAVRSARNTAQ